MKSGGALCSNARASERGVAAIGLALALTIAVGCGQCGSADVAELRGIVGSVQRDFAVSPGTWSTASAGSRFVVGDGLHTGPGARAELGLFPDGRLRVEADTVVRFSDAPPGQREGTVDVETGSVEIESGSMPLLVESPGGTARVFENSRVRVRRSGKSGIGLEVAVGRAEIERGSETLSAKSGETLALEVGRIEVERPETVVRVDATAPDAGVQVTAQAAAVETPPGIEASIEPAELEIPAGESATVHDPRPPIVVGFNASQCAQGADLDLRDFRGGTRRIRGTSTPGARLAAGSYRYTVRCAGDPQGSARGAGLLRVVRDSGGRSLPRTAPKVSLDADGRRYTVRYQNLLPELRLRWPNAPPAPSYTLELISEDGTTLREQAGTSELRLRSGRVREGEYRFVLRAGAAHSPETTLRVTFDDTARTAQLAEPKDLGFAAGAMVHVAGAALAGSSIRVGGTPLSVSSDGRFAANANAVGPGRVLAVRVQHPVAGVHYYVRRPAGAR